MFETPSEAQKWIESVQKFGEKYDLSRMHGACKMLNHPENTFKSVHIGGTNGKGSTLSFLKHILLESGYNVGTYTSPYIVHFNERISLNDKPISDEDLLRYINEIYDVQKEYRERYNDQITFFELVTLISFLYFRDQDVDVVLYEVGLGGTLDATNVISPVLSIITSVGYDHMHVLGNTLKSIAKNKLGIVKDGVPLVSGVEEKTLQKLFRSYTNKKTSPLHLTADNPVKNVQIGLPTHFDFEGETYTINMVGFHQIANAHTALLARNALHMRDDFDLPIPACKRGLKKAHMPGRFERFNNVVLDGAHNISSIEASLKTLKAYYPDKKIRILFTVMADKAYVPILKRLERFADELVFTEIPYHRSEKADRLYEQSRHRRKRFFKDFKEAYRTARPKDEDTLLFITGSLYFISAIRSYVIETQNEA